MPLCGQGYGPFRLHVPYTDVHLGGGCLIWRHACHCGVWSFGIPKPTYLAMLTQSTVAGINTVLSRLASNASSGSSGRSGSVEQSMPPPANEPRQPLPRQLFEAHTEQALPSPVVSLSSPSSTAAYSTGLALPHQVFYWADQV